MRILDDRERRNPDMIEPHLHQVVGGMLVQDRDNDLEERAEMQVVTEREPTEAEWGELSFAWKVCKHVRSNAIVLCARPRHGGHRRRPDEPRRLRPPRDREGPRRRSRARVHGLRRLLPVRRRPPAGARRRASTAIIQPGGSVRDHEVVEAVDAAGAAMVFTSRRHFRH